MSARESEGSDMGSLQRLLVEVDDRESDRSVWAHLRGREDVEVQTHRLQTGDYRVGNRLVVERKTALDFLASIRDGRLFSQAYRLSQLAAPAIFILEGTGRELLSTGMRREAIQGALITLGLVFQIPVLRSVDPEETARLMLYAARQLDQKPESLWLSRGRKPKQKRRAQLKLLQTLPGIGPHKARALLDRFGGIAAVVSADPQTLEDVDGIGKKTAEAIRWVLEETPVKYRVGRLVEVEPLWNGL